MKIIIGILFVVSVLTCISAYASGILVCTKINEDITICQYM